MVEGLTPPPRIGVSGGGDASGEELRLAHEVGRRIAQAGAVLVTGGLGGVMSAASEGAAGAGGTVLGLLPGGEPSAANPFVTIPLATGLGEARNVLVVRSAEAVIGIGGEWGTLSEIAFAKKVGRPVVLLVPRRLLASLGLPTVRDAEEAVRWALDAVERTRSKES